MKSKFKRKVPIVNVQLQTQQFQLKKNKSKKIKNYHLKFKLRLLNSKNFYKTSAVKLALKRRKIVCKSKQMTSFNSKQILMTMKKRLPKTTLTLSSLRTTTQLLSWRKDLKWLNYLTSNHQALKILNLRNENICLCTYRT